MWSDRKVARGNFSSFTVILLIPPLHLFCLAIGVVGRWCLQHVFSAGSRFFVSPFSFSCAVKAVIERHSSPANVLLLCFSANRGVFKEVTEVTVQRNSAVCDFRRLRFLQSKLLAPRQESFYEFRQQRCVSAPWTPSLVCFFYICKALNLFSSVLTGYSR